MMDHGIISDYPALNANNLSVAVILTLISAFYNKLLYFYYYLLLFALFICYNFLREYWTSDNLLLSSI